MKRKLSLFLVLLVMIIASFSLISCSEKDKSEAPPSDDNVSNNFYEYSDLLKSYLTNKYSSIEDFHIIDLKKYTDEHVFVQFLLSVEKIKYEGVAYIYQNKDGYQIAMEEDTIIDTESSITKLMVIGELRNSSLKYKMVSGVVHEKSIEKLLIKYKDNSNVIIKFDNSKRSYIDVRVLPTNDQIEVENILGLDHDDKVVFKMAK